MGPALIIVGALMLGNVVKIRWDLVSEAVPAFVTIAIMPLTYSIAYGVASWASQPAQTPAQIMALCQAWQCCWTLKAAAVRTLDGKFHLHSCSRQSGNCKPSAFLAKLSEVARLALIVLDHENILWHMHRGTKSGGLKDGFN